MSLRIGGQTYLSTAEAADRIGYALQTFHDKRSRHGDRFIKAYELVPGRMFYRVEDIERVAAERGQ